jgi:hypothetical protein
MALHSRSAPVNHPGRSLACKLAAPRANAFLSSLLEPR